MRSNLIKQQCKTHHQCFLISKNTNIIKVCQAGQYGHWAVLKFESLEVSKSPF